jgi:hypothetical protein
MSGERFDNWQFQGRYQRRAVSAESKISFDDYTRSMKTEFRAEGRGWVPPFALNNEQLQKVLLTRAWRYIHHVVSLPKDVEWQEVARVATEKALQPHKIKSESPRIQKEMLAAHVSAVIRAGGLLQLWAAIAFRAWRLGQDSIAVGESLGVSPGAVRINLFRLRDIARSLGYDTGQPHHSYQSKDHSKRLKKAWKQRKRQDAKYQEACSAAS